MVVRKALTLQLVWSSDLKEVNKGAIWKENIPDRVTASAKARRQKELGMFKGMRTDGCAPNGVSGIAG